MMRTRSWRHAGRLNGCRRLAAGCSPARPRRGRPGVRTPRGRHPAAPLWAAHPRRQSAHAPQVPNGQTDAEAARKSAGCLTCHQPDRPTMHVSAIKPIGCTDCHGGDASVMLPQGAARGSAPFNETKKRAHVAPRLDIWKTSANPVRSAVLDESLEFIRFVNPGDLRVADQTCAPCHTKEVTAVRSSMMTHGGDALGRGALQQRRVSAQDVPVRRVLHARRPAGQSRRSRRPRRTRSIGRHAAVPGAALPVGGVAAGQRAADLRARRPEAARGRQSRSR